MNKQLYKFEPDWLHLMPPGEFILEDMENLGLSQRDLANRTEYSTKHIHKLLKGEAPINADTALRLEKVLGVAASFWMNLENIYREALAKEEEKIALAKKKEWLKKIPLKNMLTFGWVDKYSNKGEQIAACLKFYGCASIDAWNNQRENNVAFKSTDRFTQDEIAVRTWLRRGENEAAKIACDPFDKKILQASLNSLRALTLIEELDDFLPKLKDLCAKCGIAVVFSPTPDKCPISGATRWLSSKKALLLLSLRYKTNDHLWFAFFHEIAHILKHKKQLFLEDTQNKFVQDKALEDEANKFSKELLIPAKHKERLETLKTKKSIQDFSDEIGIASGIVIGRMQYEKIIQFSCFNDLKVKYQWAEK
ncbi:Antitoxin HigA / unknown domain [uncultured Gammaproteobacteria bacterium]|jgi:addiction module HigA family antidote|nr:Antitoxin HigA / unknown domain [uncultured Gammaproteobacteria bacterium]